MADKLIKVFVSICVLAFASSLFILIFGSPDNPSHSAFITTTIAVLVGSFAAASIVGLWYDDFSSVRKEMPVLTSYTVSLKSGKISIETPGGYHASISRTEWKALRAAIDDLIED